MNTLPYAAKDTWIDELEMLHRRCPMGVFSHDEAFYYYGLTDREPLVHTLTIYAFAATCNKRGTDHLQEQAEEIIKIIEADTVM